MKFKIGIAIFTLALSGLIPAYADSNVALGGQVTFSGPGFGNYSSTWGAGSLANAQSVTDGLFLPTGQQWNLGTVFWNGSGDGDPYNTVTVQLNQLSTVSSLVLQADNNDNYGVEYKNAQGSWVSLTTLVPPRSWGLETAQQLLSTPVTTGAFRIRSVAGDGYYSVSEFQAIGTVAAVPEPESFAMLLGGLGLMGAIARRRKQRTNSF
jgi:hypothetical protein